MTEPRSGEIEIKHDLVYSNAGGRPLHLDLWLPADAGPHPVLLYIHGGAWTGGTKEQGAELLAVAAGHGYLAATVEYRLAGEAMWPAQVEDCQAAVEWLVANAAEYGGDPDRLVVTGGSAGGHLAELLALGWGVDGGGKRAGVQAEVPWPERPVRACCPWFGVSDLRVVGELQSASSNIEQFLGADQDTRSENAAEASPVLYINAGDPPVLLIHGTADHLVPFRQSERMLVALESVGVPARLIAVEGGGHGVGIGDADKRKALAEEMLDWFDQQMGIAAH